MILNDENYYSQEADMEYLSASQYKAFAGTLGHHGCEARALAMIKGEWQEEPTTALLVGGYVDAYFDGTLEKFKAEHLEIFTKKGELRAEYQRANTMIERAERSEFFMLHMAGERQVIMTAEMFGAKWKIKMDFYFPGKLIVDLKTVQGIGKTGYSRDFGNMDFVREWGYDLQLSIYQKVVEINTGKKLPVRIAAISKEPEPDIEIIQIEQGLLDNALAEVEKNTPNIVMVKNGELEPVRCEMRDCNYCKHTKVLTDAVWSSSLLGDL